VIKFITVRIDEEEKRLAKVKALRGVRRTAAPAVVAAVVPVAAVPVETPAPAEVAEPVQASA
jgi:small subunit ribosomal protein S6